MNCSVLIIYNKTYALVIKKITPLVFCLFNLYFYKIIIKYFKDLRNQNLYVIPSMLMYIIHDNVMIYREKQPHASVFDYIF